ncbi:alkaline phosphatase [Microlunatus elymi]|uniref:Alkaline phosphatase n=1 Tax=Microlunatus elymi TaxID=2596828 RepID=A0A516PXB6_9ACTN|nr:alkaline phosphatase [Microlunatus elymi]QDP95792.1 alkaline phosphatase [Microlunatus elymi]
MSTTSESARRRTVRRRIAAVGALALACSLGASVASATGGSLPLLNRVAQGKVDKPGGAARLDGDQTQLIRNSLKSGKVRNVILFIGDGMGDSEITVARNYLEGAGGAFKGIDALPLTGQMTHYSVNKDTGLPDYTPDSAATGTAWATGTKSYDGAISVDRFGKSHKTLLELAKKKGFATGDVTTSEIQDATPAVQVAHVSSRSCYGPEATSKTCPEDALENGGSGSITEQLLKTRPDVTIGGGSATFDEVAKAGKWKGQTLAAQAKRRGYNYVTDKESLAGVRSADQDRPLLAVMAPGNMPVKFAPSTATHGGALEAAQTCTRNPDFAQVPALPAMTNKAINLLSGNKAGKKNGFFLQVESASIDKQDHAANACGQIGETEQLDLAVQKALQFAEKDGHTLVIVTADHAHTSQIVDGNTPGLTTKLKTREGSEMVVSYNTAEAGGSQQHTGTQLRVAAYGPEAGNVVGLIDQTDLNGIISRSLALR